MNVSLKILHLEDDSVDAELVRRTLLKYETPFEIKRVITKNDFENALNEGDFSLILSDYNLASFDGSSALALAREKCPQIPFIFVSGSIGEERAIESLRNGATDYILKDGLIRLLPSVERALGESKIKTENRQLEEKFRQSQKMEALGRLAGGIAHDFNNWLNVISSYTEMMLMDLPKENPFYRGLEEIQLATEKSSALTKQLLAFSRKQVLQPKIIDLNTAIAQANKMFHRIVGEHIKLETQLAKDLGKVKMDPNHFEQILLNLIVNCRDAMPKGGKILIETYNATKEDGKFVVFSVKDEGVGMSDEVKKHLFEPFFTTKEEGKGTGLGLATVFSIVQQSKGSLEVESALRKGALIKIYFPRIAAS